MAKTDRKAEARRLRTQGFMFSEIAERLGISKSTAGHWCSDLVLTRKAQENIDKRAGDGRQKGRLLGTQSIKAARLKRVVQAESEASELVGKMSARDLLVSGAALYWGEGSKDRKLTFTNTNPQMLRFMMRWFRESLGVSRRDFHIWVYINSPHEDRIGEIMSFWIRELRIPSSQFARPIFLKSRQTKVYEKRNTYYGVVSLRIRKSTALQYKVLGLIKAISILPP